MTSTVVLLMGVPSLHILHHGSLYLYLSVLYEYIASFS